MGLFAQRFNSWWRQSQNVCFWGENNVSLNLKLAKPSSEYITSVQLVLIDFS